MDDQRIERIITAVLKRLLPHLGVDGSRGKIIAVLTGATVQEAEAATQLRALLLAGFELQIVFSEMAEHLYGELLRGQLAGFPCWSQLPPVRWFKSLHEARAVVSPLLSVNSLSKLALVVGDNQTSNILLHGLFMGKPVIVARNGFDLNPGRAELGFHHANPALSRQIEERANAVASYGCALVDVSQLCATTLTLLGEPQRELSVAENAEPVIKEREFVCDSVVVSVGDVQQACELGTSLHIAPRALVTPLAQERAAALGVLIVRDGNRQIEPGGWRDVHSTGDRNGSSFAKTRAAGGEQDSDRAASRAAFAATQG